MIDDQPFVALGNRYSRFTCRNKWLFVLAHHLFVI